MNMNTHPRSNGELRWFGNTLVAIRLSSLASDDKISVIEHWMPWGETPPLHVHHREDEVFHLLEGEMRFQIGQREVHASAGQTLVAPKGIPHSFRVESVAGAHCLTITRGDDFETMLRQTSRVADRAELPAATAPSPEIIDALTRCCAENHIAIVGPPLS